MTSLFGSRAPTQLAPEDSAAKALAIKQEVAQQLALANAQELVNKMNDNFASCITKPTERLTPSDEGCLARCSDRFLEAFNLISTKYVQRVQRERESNVAGLQ